MATCIYGVRLTDDHYERCAWCRADRERAARLDDISRLRELIGMYGNLRRDVGAFGGVNTAEGREALRRASTQARDVYEEIERILYRLREASIPALPVRPNPKPEPGAGPRDPGWQEEYGCATCGQYVEFIPPKFDGDPEQGWRHKGLPPSDVRAHVVRPQRLG